MDDLTCRFAVRYHDLRSSLWSALGLPPTTSDSEIVAAIMNEIHTRQQTECDLYSVLILLRDGMSLSDAQGLVEAFDWLLQRPTVDCQT